MGRVVWSVREGGFDAPEILGGYRSANPVHEPRLREVLHLPDGRVVGGSSTGRWPIGSTPRGTCSSSNQPRTRRRRSGSAASSGRREIDVVGLDRAGRAAGSLMVAPVEVRVRDDELRR